MVIVVPIRVIIERRIGNIELVCTPVLACSKVPGTEITLERKKVMMSIIILPTIPAMRLPREFISIFCVWSGFGQKLIIIVLHNKPPQSPLSGGSIICSIPPLVRGG
jgi:hypothetical protein